MDDKKLSKDYLNTKALNSYIFKQQCIVIFHIFILYTCTYKVFLFSLVSEDIVNLGVWRYIFGYAQMIFLLPGIFIPAILHDLPFYLVSLVFWVSELLCVYWYYRIAISKS
jgi:hypothetical protein